MPTELHLALQRYYAGETGLVETEIEGYRTDVLRDGVVYEVQTGSFASIRDKLQALVKTHPVVLVFPIAQTKIVAHLDPDSGSLLRQRRSPRRGALTDVFEELLYITSFLQHDSASLEVLMTVKRELRQDDGKGSWRRKGVSLVGHELLAILARHRFTCPADFLPLLPTDLPCRFTVADLAEAMAVNRRMAGRAAYGLRQLGTIRRIGKRGNAFLYERAD